MMICNIEDCRYNKDAECVLDLFQDSDECREKVKVKQSSVKDIKIDRVFDVIDLIQISINTASKGQQRKWVTKDSKWFIKEQFYYQCRYWNDPLTEVIGSKVCKDLGIDHQEYGICKVGNRLASYAAFESDKLLPFSKLDKAEDIEEYYGIDRIKFAAEVLGKWFTEDPLQYLADMTLVDFIIGNEDRHLRNFGSTDSGRPYPLFDFGLSLFEHDYIYSNLTLSEAIPKMNKQPFHDWDMALDYFAGLGLLRSHDIDLTGYTLPNSLSREYLEYSCQKVGMKICGI